MRVTNMMLTNNSLINMGKSKERYMNAMEQYITEKKIQRPSDDPIIAVRALKYRTNLYQLNQYLDKNIKDAFSWMEATEEAILPISDKITEMHTICDTGANGTWELDELNSMIEELKQCKEFIYEQQLNTDFAGRYVFTGYRTNTPMLFDTLTTDLQYTITEKHKAADIARSPYMYGGAEYGDGKTAEDYAGEAPDLQYCHKMMLGYDNLDDKEVRIEIKDASGNTVRRITATTKSIHDGDVYNVDTEEAHFIPETGELVFHDDVYKEIVQASGFEVTYDKSEFAKGDIRPEHYFNCKSEDSLGKFKEYSNPEGQDIKYEINFSQTLTVNTLGCNVIGHEIGRMVDEIVSAADSWQQALNKQKEIEKKLENTDPNNEQEVEALNKLLEQVSTEVSLKEKILHDLFGAGLTATTNAEQKVNVALANHGSRYTRLEMTYTKLSDQQVDFEQILSDNEDVDLGEAYIRYNQADMLYQASLSATSKLLGNSLLNFI